MIIRFAKTDEYPQIQQHYKACNYNGGVALGDVTLIAVDKQIIGAVRICTEHSVKVLRGMYLLDAYQKKGIGLMMLKYLDEHTDMANCYCIPYRHLKPFYANIGFEEIVPAAAPVFLKDRLAKYLSTGNRELIIMKRDK